MTPKFKPGPAKTRDGKEAYIFEVSDEKIFAKYFEGKVWTGLTTHPDGKLYQSRTERSDLMPNCEPFKWEGEVEWLSSTVVYPSRVDGHAPDFRLLSGKRGHLVFIESEE